MGETLPSTLDLLSLLPGPFRKEAGTSGGEWSAPCPRCGGRDRFRVWPQATPKPHAWCRGCGWQPDLVDVLRECHGLSYADATAAVTGQRPAPLLPPRSNAPVPPPAPVDDQPPAPAWQQRARAIAARAQAVLWSDAGAAARAYLRTARHLTDATIRAAQLGYVPVDLLEPPARWGLSGGKRIWLPRGLLLPTVAAGQVWALKVRRDAGEPKYSQPRGSRPALYGADGVVGRPVLIVAEGELDALLLRQQAGDLVDVVTLGSATNPLAVRWLPRLLAAGRLLVAYDADAAGRRGSAVLAAVSARVSIARPVGAKDLTDMVTAGGNLRAWVRYQLGPPAADGAEGAGAIADREPVWDPNTAAAWRRVIVEDVGVLYGRLEVDARAAYVDRYRQLQGPLLLPVLAAAVARNPTAYHAALAAFEAAARPIRAAVAAMLREGGRR